MTAPTTSREPLLLGALAFVGYFAVSRAVENLYPFSVFDMYAHAHAPSGSRLVLVDERGALREVSEGLAFACDPPEPDASACSGPDVYSPAYLDREAVARVRARRGDDPAARPASLVRRIWRFPPGAGPPELSDCVVARCRVVFP